MINFDTRTIAVGDDAITEIDFDFLITKKADLLFTIVEAGQDPITFDGDDTTYLDTVTFDSVSGGGTVTLLAALATGKTLYIDLNVVEPEQTFMFRDRSTFSLRSLENVLDYIVTALQTLTRNFQQTPKFARHVDVSAVSLDLPETLFESGNEGKCYVVNDTLDGFEVGFSRADMDAAVTAAEAAQAAAEAAQAAAQLAETNAETAETNAETAETNAEAAQAAAEAAQTAAETARDQAVYDVQGSVTTPELVDGAAQVALTGVTRRHFLIIEGDGGAVDQSGVNPQIDPPLNDGDELTMLCNSNTNTVKFATGNGLVMNGDYVMVQNSMISFIGVNSIWVEKSRNNI